MYVYNLTKGKAQGYLEPRYKTLDGVNEFRTADEMIRHLSTIFVDLFKVRNAKLKYWSTENLIKTRQLFSKFYNEFLQLISDARILEEDYCNDLVNKITLSL